MLSVQHFFLTALLLSALAPQSASAKCPKNCFSCYDAAPGQCSLCNTGYGLSSQNLCNVKCPANCDDCNAKDAPAGQCSDCAYEYGLTSQNLCTKCPTGCSDCDMKSSPATCSSCLFGYGLTGKTCSKCPDGCSRCDINDVPAGQCSDCDEGYNITPQKTCTKDCSIFKCCNYDCPSAKAGTCSADAGNFGDLAPLRTISWKTTAKRLTLKACQATCLKDPSCFAYRLSETQNCVGNRPCGRCPCTTLGQHDGTCQLFGADAKTQLQKQPNGSGYIFTTRVGGYCWH